MPLADYKNPTGEGYIDPDGSWAENATDLLQCGFLHMCGCGTPEDNLRYVHGGLLYIENYFENVEKKEPTHTQSFFYYWADREGFTEHGIGLPGWLTDKGKHLLALLHEWICTEIATDIVEEITEKEHHE